MNAKQRHAETIIDSEAWECGDKDCSQQWHQANYWVYSDGSCGVDSFADGDHESIPWGDMPTGEHIRASWLRYAEYVAETGKDPLGNYWVAHKTRKERWQFRFANSIVGVCVVNARRAGREVAIAALPAHVREYLGNPEGRNHVLPDYRLTDAPESPRERFETDTGINLSRHAWHTVTLDVPVHRTDEQLAAALRKAARADLRRK